MKSLKNIIFHLSRFIIIFFLFKSFLNSIGNFWLKKISSFLFLLLEYWKLKKKSTIFDPNNKLFTIRWEIKLHHLMIPSYYTHQWYTRRDKCMQMTFLSVMCTCVRCRKMEEGEEKILLKENLNKFSFDLIWVGWL
jgi:hypothetical protein